jgi:NTP pyrophosphatase (non-canonical NTP hydrolase)
MSYSLRFLSEVKGEVTEAFEWYESKRSGLGEEFAEELESVFSRIQNHPTSFSFDIHNSRKAILSKESKISCSITRSFSLTRRYEILR